jgi:putative thioredoxin
MGYQVEVNRDNYRQEVIESSYLKPVLVDFFALWCGPCQILKPILEKLVQEYDFILATIDIDLNPDLAEEFGVEGVPDVRIVQRGEMRSGFVGVLAEPQLRGVLEQLNLNSDLNESMALLEQAIAAQNFLQAKKTIDELFASHPGHPKVILQATSFLMLLERLDEGEKLLATMKTAGSEYTNQVQALQTLMEIKRLLKNSPDRDISLDEQFAEGIKQALGCNYERALAILLEIIRQNRQYRADGARKAMLAIFNWLGAEHPLSRQYRQKLMIIL